MPCVGLQGEEATILKIAGTKAEAGLAEFTSGLADSSSSWCLASCLNEISSPCSAIKERLPDKQPASQIVSVMPARSRRCSLCLLCSTMRRRPGREFFNSAGFHIDTRSWCCFETQPHPVVERPSLRPGPFIVLPTRRCTSISVSLTSCSEDLERRASSHKL